MEDIETRVRENTRSVGVVGYGKGGRKRAGDAELQSGDDVISMVVTMSIHMINLCNYLVVL